MMSSSRGGGSCRYPFPFTGSQWQELEHQALIFKYMASGIPIPSDLILSIKNWTTPSSLAFSHLHHHQPAASLGWGCLQMGFGRKGDDPEPGRCRRTDGKKWRCSKEAYPDSKYCERHMHRGKNRSRKPVEMSLAPAPLPAAATAISSSSSSSASSQLFPSSLSISTPESSNHHHFLYPFSHSSSSSSSSRLPSQSCNNNNAFFNGENGTPFYFAERDHCRYSWNGVKEVDEYSLFSQSSTNGNGGERELGSSLQFRPLDEEKQRQQQQQQQQHCFVLGADFKQQEREEPQQQQQQQPLRHFFDEWPERSRTTQLSISIPMAGGVDFPITGSRYAHED